MNMPSTLSKVKLQYKHVQWHTHCPYETTTDPVITKGPEVMLETVTQCRKIPTVLLADHAKCSQTPRICQALRILAPRR